MKIDNRGRVTIPKNLRDRYGLSKGVEVDFIDEGDGIRMVKWPDGASRVAQVRGTLKLAPGESVDQFIEDIRGR